MNDQVRLLNTTSPMPHSVREWFAINRTHCLQDVHFAFVWDGARDPVWVLAIAGEVDTYPLAIAEPIVFRYAAQLCLLPRALEFKQGQPTRVLLEYVDFKPRPGRIDEVTEPCK